MRLDQALEFARRGASLALVLVALYLSIDLVRQLRASDDGGPPMAALALGVPIMILLIAAGALWEGNRPARRRH